MKILNIYFKNINSLEGESRIHFDQAPFSNGGVFAITGPNGSGKSSILDAIALGLYGETFRFDRPAKHVMTKTTTESFAHVEFLLGEDTFRSSWHVKREGGHSAGQLLTPEMELVQLNGSNEHVLEQNAQSVRSKMAELTGMDFHKFSKSMVLAQGDFAAFLNALDSERMDILEKISGTDIYVDYQQQVEEKNTQARTLLQQLEQDLNAIPVMGASTIEAKQEDLADFQQQQVELKQQQDEIQQQLVQAKNISELENQLKVLTDKQLQGQGQLEKTQHTLDKIDDSLDVASFEGQVTKIENKIEETQQSKASLDSFRSELEMLQKQLKADDFVEPNEMDSEKKLKTLAEQKSSIDRLKLKVIELKSELPRETTLLESLAQHIDEKKQALITTELWLQEHIDDKNLLVNFPEIEKLNNLRVEVHELEQKQKTSAKYSKSSRDSFEKSKSNLAKLNNINANLKVQIVANEKSIEENSEGNSLIELQEMLIEQQERVENFQELHDLAGVNAKLGKKGLFGLSFLSKNIIKEEQQLVEEADRLQLKIGREQNILQALELAVSNEQLLQKMQNDRVHLVDGKPCPLCGAMEHPYSKHAPAVSNSKQILAEQKKNVKALISEAQSVAKQITAVHVQTEKDEQKGSQLEVVCSQWNSLANRLNAAGMDLDIEDLSLMKSLLKKEKKELSNISHLIKKCSKQQHAILDAKATIEANESSFERLIVESEQLQLEAEENNSPQQANELLQACSKSQEKEQALAEIVVKQLAEFGEKMPATGKEQALLTRLNNKKQEFQSQQTQQYALTEEIKGLEAKITASSAKIEQVNHELQQFSVQVQQEESAGLHLSVIEKQKLIAEKESVISQQEADLTTLKQNLSEQTKGTEASNLDSLTETIALAKQQPALEQQQAQLTQSLIATQERMDNIQSQLEAEQVTGIINNTEEELVAKQKSITEKLDIARQEADILQNKLERQDDLQDKYQDFQARIESQKAVVEESEVDIKLIHDENGHPFRRKVQQLMSDKLLSRSNQILEKINGRYYVRKVESEHGLALEVEDTKQQNVRRLPKTLSGGESFIVSLALALGLAEMANNGQALDSLFLDEGFGSLDAESLYAALTTLENLKTHGKVVGIISHVEGVRKRIKTQIKMKKKPNGLSALKVIS